MKPLFCKLLIQKNKQMKEQQLLQEPCELCDKIVDSFQSYAGLKGRICGECRTLQVDHLFDPLHEIIEGVYLGNQEAAKNQQLLETYSISAICICGADLKIHKYQRINPEVRVYKIYDCPKQKISLYFDQNNKFIEEMRIANRNILIHCAAGVSRSASFVIAYLMKTRQLQFLDAYLQVKRKRRCVKPNMGFIQQLKAYSPNQLNEKQ